MQMIRLILYAVSAVLFAVLASRLVPVRHVLARWFGVLLVANAINAASLFIMLFFLVVADETKPSLATVTWTFNALVMAAVAIGLIVAFYRAEHNGNGP